MATLKDLIADKSFADNMVYQMGNGVAVTLGELRALGKGDQSALDKREQELTTRQDQLQNAFKELQLAQANTAKLYAETQAEKERLEGLAKNSNGSNNSNNIDPFAQFEADPILGAPIKAIRAEQVRLQNELKAKDDLFKQVAAGVNKLTEGYLTDRLTDQYEQVVPADKREKISLESLIKLGMDNKYTTKSGYVDIKRAYADLTVNERTDGLKKAGYDEGYKKAMEEIAAKGIVVDRPGGGGGMLADLLPGANREASPFKNLDEAFAAAAKDTDLWRNNLSTMPIS